MLHKKYLAILVTSIQVKCVFLVAKLVVIRLQASLVHENVDILVVLNKDSMCNDFVINI